MDAVKEQLRKKNGGGNLEKGGETLSRAQGPGPRAHDPLSETLHHREKKGSQMPVSQRERPQ